MLVATQVAPASAKEANRSLIDNKLWDRLVARIVADGGVDRPLAERILDQTLAFLRLCAIDQKREYAPSPAVDIGWHTFILYTMSRQMAQGSTTPYGKTLARTAPNRAANRRAPAAEVTAKH